MQRQPYLIASVAYLPEESAAAVAEPAQQLRQLYARYWAAISAATGYEAPDETLPEQVVDLTYWMANRLQVGNRAEAALAGGRYHHPPARDQRGHSRRAGAVADAEPGERERRRARLLELRTE